MDLKYFWSLTPKQFFKYVEVYKAKQEAKFKEIDVANFNLGRYIRIAVNDAYTGSTNYPDQPFSAKPEPKQMTAEEMERMFSRMARRINKKVKDSK